MSHKYRGGGVDRARMELPAEHIPAVYEDFQAVR